MRTPIQREDLLNREGDTDFAVQWHEPPGRAGHDLTAVLRVKNEARNLPWVLPPLFECVDEMIVVDNNSDDGTPEIARDLADRHGFGARLRVVTYPFAVSRCGSEHLDTPPDSLHSLTYFYNWAFSQVRTRYALKWDGDMILTPRGRRLIRDFAWQSETVDSVLRIPRHAVYLSDGSEAWIDLDLENIERWAWPNKPAYFFYKGVEWEMPARPDGVNVVWLPEGCCFEIKWLDLDEFDHWSDDEFDGRHRQTRKAREMAMFVALRDGLTEDLGRTARLRAEPRHGHVLEHVTELTASQWEDLAHAGQ